MKHIKKYNDFFQFNEKESFYYFVDYYYNELLTKNEKIILEQYIDSTLSIYLINENFFNKIKNRYDKASKVVKNFPDKAKKSLNKVLDAAKTSMEFVKNIVSQLNEFIKKLINETPIKIKNKLKSDKKIISEIKKIEKGNKQGLVTDINECKNVIGFYKKQLGNILSKNLTDSFTKTITADDLPVEEKIQFINESISMGKNVISSLIHKLETYPPFNLLKNVTQMSEKGANYIINGLSYFTEKMGGPSFKLPVIASVIGMAMEYNLEGLAKHGFIQIVGLITIPTISTLMKLIGYIATFIATVVLVDEICNLGLLSGKHKDGEIDKQRHTEPEYTNVSAPKKPEIKPEEQNQYSPGNDSSLSPENNISV